jgi:hypothetical protein
VNFSRFLLPRQLRQGSNEMSEDEREVLAKIIMAVTLRVAALVVVPILIVIMFAVHEGRARADAIDESRARIAYVSCVAQNKRNVAALSALDEIIAKRTFTIQEAKVGADKVTVAALDAELLRISSSRETTSTLIEALQPHVDCLALVEQRFNYIPKEEDRA